MKFNFLIFALLLSSVSIFAQSKDEESLKSLARRMTEAQANFQPEALDQILTSDYLEISPVGDVDSRDKVLSFYKPELKPPAEKMSVKNELDEFSIRLNRDFAIVIVRVNYLITSEGKAFPPRSMRLMIVCRKEKGAWKIASTQYTGIRSAQTVSPAKSD